MKRDTSLSAVTVRRAAGKPMSCLGELVSVMVEFSSCHDLKLGGFPSEQASSAA